MTLAVLGWLIRDVFRRARASNFSAAIMFAIVAATAICLTLTPTADGLTLFGWLVARETSAEEAGRQFLFYLSIAVGDIFGVFVILLATAGFLAEFLDPATATVLLSKPPARGAMLLARFAGVVLFVTVFSGLFVACTAVAVGLRTGAWAGGYWLAWPLLVIQFIAFASLGALVAVATRNSVAVMLGSIFFALVSWGISFGKHFLTAIQIEEARPEFGHLVGWVYWILPKPTDFSLMLHDALGVSPSGLSGIGLRPIMEQHLYNPALAVTTTLGVAVVLLALAVYELNHQDY